MKNVELGKATGVDRHLISNIRNRKVVPSRRTAYLIWMASGEKYRHLRGMADAKIHVLRELDKEAPDLL